MASVAAPPGPLPAEFCLCFVHRWCRDQLEDRISLCGELLFIFGHDIALVHTLVMVKVAGNGGQGPAGGSSCIRTTLTYST